MRRTPHTRRRVRQHGQTGTPPVRLCPRLAVGHRRGAPRATSFATTADARASRNGLANSVILAASLAVRFDSRADKRRL
jgi:hypothetical protein